MGTLTLAAHGPLYVDTNLIIYRVEHVQPYLSASMPLWDALRDGTHQVITSELSLLETIVKPIQLGNLTLQHLFERILYNTRGFSCVPVDRQTLETAAHLRATAGLKTPDAIHAATALITNCTQFITNDPAFRGVPKLGVTVLSEVIAAP